jgi:MFS family permease
MVVTALYTAIAGAGLPYVAVYLGSRFHLPAALIGALVTALGILNLPVQLGGGHLSDSWGRRPLLIAGTAAGALGCAGLALAPLLVVAIASLVLLEAGFALFFPITQAMAADLARGEGRDTPFALVYAAVGIGWAAGTIVAGVAGSWSYGLLFGAGAAFGLLAVVAAVTIGESAPRRESPAGGGLPVELSAWQDPAFLWFGVLELSVWIVGGQLLVTLPLWVVHELGYSNAFFGLLMALNGVLIAAGQVLLSGSVKRLPTAGVLALGSLGFGAGYELMSLRAAWALVLGTLILTIGEMLLVPTTSAALERLAPKGRGGQYQGAGATLQSVGISLGPLPGGVLLQLGGPFLWTACLAWCLACGAGYLAYGRWRRLA